MNRLACLTASLLASAGCTLESAESTDPVDSIDTEAALVSPSAQPTTTYNLSGRTSPAAAATGAFIDGKLTITFDSAPSLASSGTVQIAKNANFLSEQDTVQLKGYS
jgi:pectate lyase